jgi:hypothetical protein
MTFFPSTEIVIWCGYVHVRLSASIKRRRNAVGKCPFLPILLWLPFEPAHGSQERFAPHTKSHPRLTQVPPRNNYTGPEVRVGPEYRVGYQLPALDRCFFYLMLPDL